MFNIPESYVLINKQMIPEMNSTGYYLKHKRTDAKLCLIENDDDNKVFMIGFRTPPDNSKGIPHILEHSVLCGSKKYPVKDPFIELVKGSLNTFLNAMTYPDKTLYPVASRNDKDFQNLMSVYMDAVFYPNIYETDKIFAQEGWHYELDSIDADIRYNGVVYNEMKGAFSSPESVLDRVTKEKLFPNTPYANESGGDPDFITDLSYEEFLDFHKKYYHPSNSYIYLYGDMNMEEKLLWLDKEYLGKFEKTKIDSEIPEQKPFDRMESVEIPYGITDGEDEENGTYLSWNKVTGTILNPYRTLSFQILEYALLSAPGAPLKQALLDAGIGKDIIGGFDSGQRQTYFSIIAKGANPEQKLLFIRTIKTTLGKISEKGINKKSLFAGINLYEFKYREADFGRYPKGLIYGLQCFDSWLYNEDAWYMYLEYEEIFKFLKTAVDNGYFESMIDKYLLANEHGIIVTAIPKKGYIEQKDNEIAKKLAKYKSSLSKKELQAMIYKTKELKEYQEKASTKEELELIPMLSVNDIEKQAEPLYIQEKTIDGVKVIQHNIFTSGIGYLTIVFHANEIMVEDLPYLSLLKSILGGVNTEHFTYQELSDEINLLTGGIYMNTATYHPKDKPEAVDVTFEIRSKVLYEKLADAFKMITEIITTSKIEDEKRVREIVSQLKSRSQSALLASGHSAAVLRATSYYSVSAYLSEQLGGIAYYQFLEELDKHFDEMKSEVFKKLRDMIGILFTRENLLVSYAANDGGFEYLPEQITAFKEILPDRKTQRVERAVFLEKRNEGFKTSSQVQYVARCGNFREDGFSYTGAMKVLKVILSYDYLWINIRVKGGAYGCMSGFSDDGECYFTSYRDPNIAETNQIYDGIASYLSKFEVDNRDMTKYIIGTISDLDTPMNPSAKAANSLGAYLSHISYKDIQKERDEVLNTNVTEIRKLADPIRAVLEQDYLCVVGNDAKIEKNKEMFIEVKQLFH